MDSERTVFDAIVDGDLRELDGLLTADPDRAGARDGTGRSAVLVARYHGREDAIERLLACGPLLDVFDAAGLGLLARVRELLDEDPARASAPSPDGFTPLHLASYFGHSRTAELLLATGADPTAVATNGTRLQPLHGAAAAGHATIAHLLLDLGADVGAAQAGGYTPLHAAAHNGDGAMTRLLLDRGADPYARADDGRSPLDVAEDPAVRTMLLEVAGHPVT